MASLSELSPLSASKQVVLLGTMMNETVLQGFKGSKEIPSKYVAPIQGAEGRSDKSWFESEASATMGSAT